MRELISFSRATYQWVRYKLFILVTLMLFAALLEGLGVGLFLPLLQGVEADNQANRILSSVFEYLDWSYTYRAILGFMVVFFVLRSAFLVIQSSYAGAISADFLTDVRNVMVRRIFKADYTYLSTKNVGYLNNAVVTEFSAMAFAFKMYATILVKMIFVIMYTVLPLMLNFTLTAAVLIFGIPAYFVIKKINILTKDYSAQQTDHSGRLQEFLIQSLNYLKYFKATHAYESMLDKISRESHTLGSISRRSKVLQSITQYAFEPLGIIALAALLFYQVEMLGQEILEVVFLVYLLKQAISNLLGLQQLFRKFLSATGSFKVYQTLDEELAINLENLEQNNIEPDFEAPIEFKNVSFHYREDQPILNNINLTIPPKSTVAIVGPSGSGKSTMVNLLTGLLKPKDGTLHIGDTNYDAVNRILLRGQIGYITQENVIFNDSIRNNIALWNPHISDHDIQQAASKAHISEFIESLPEGYDTQLGDAGINISGGQRQRIMIARELCKQSQLLIFDEATSALDTHSEHEIQNNISEFQGQKTIVLIAHRLSTVKQSDLIIVLKDGQIAEQGTYNELYHLNGEFRAMVDQQATQSADIAPLSLS